MKIVKIEVIAAWVLEVLYALRVYGFCCRFKVVLQNDAISVNGIQTPFVGLCQRKERIIHFSIPMLLRDAEMAVTAGLCASRFEVFRKDIRHEIRHAWQYELLDIEGIDEFDFQYISSPLEQDAYAIQLYDIAQSAEEFIASVRCAM